MEEFDIREATPEDAEKIIAYLAQVGGETDYLSFGKEGLPISTEEEEKFIQNINKEEHSVLYVVWKNGEIIGDASLSGFSRRMSHRAEFGISVVKSEWGQGIGRALLQKCIMYAKEHTIELINLEVRSDNIRAIHVYEKYGFRKIGTSPAYFKIDGEYYDFDLMVLDLRREDSSYRYRCGHHRTDHRRSRRQYRSRTSYNGSTDELTQKYRGLQRDPKKPKETQSNPR